MAYNPKLGAMSSPFGENPNEGSIIKQDPYEMPPEDDGRPNADKNVINGPQDIAAMMDEAYGGLLDGHNKAQDRLQTTKKDKEDIVKVKSKTEAVEQPKKEKSEVVPMATDTKNEIIKNLINSGMNIKNVFDDVIVAEVNGQEIYISDR